MKGTSPQKVRESVDGLSKAPGASSGASKQTQAETRRVTSAAAVIGLVAISVSSLFVHQKGDRVMAAEPAGKGSAIGIEKGSVATETPTLSYSPASEALGAVTMWFAETASGHEWSPEKYWSLGWGQQQFQEISVEATAPSVLDSVKPQLTQIAEASTPSSDIPPSGLVATGSWETSTSAKELAANVPGLTPERTSVHPIYADSLRAEIQGLREKYDQKEVNRDRQQDWSEAPRVVLIGMGSQQIREAQPSLGNRHRVMPGETLAGISRQYDVSIAELMQANQLTDGNEIKVNQLLTIPSKEPATSLEIARAESSTFNNALARVEHNRYINGLLLEIERRQQNQATSGENSRVNNGASKPVGQPEPQSASAAAESSRSSTRRETATQTTKRPERIAAAPIRRNSYDQLMPFGQTVSPQLPPLQTPDRYLPEGTAPFNGYIWPAKGTLTSGYGWRWGRMHKGIDIAGPIGTPVVSAGSGVVDFAGWNRGGYGNLVEIRHPDGTLTRYAHNHRILVNKGQEVKQGQQIAEMGSTGYSTGPHLHFEIHPQGLKADNPISYLPQQK